MRESRENDGLSDDMRHLLQTNEILKENYEAAAAALLAIRAEDEGWAPLRSLEQPGGFALTHMHQIYEKAKLQTAGNPLLKQGFTLRASWVWGRGIELVGEDHKKPRFKKLMDKNYRVLFSQDAFTTMERALFNAGNLFMAYRRSTNTAFPIPFGEITQFASNPDRIADVWYYQRSYNKVNPVTGRPDTQETVEWYPVWETVNGDIPLRTTISDQPVVPDVVIVDVRVNRDEDTVWGVPDVLPAMPYAWAHSEYLRDGSKLLKALSTIAWKVVSKSKGNAATAGAKMADVRRAGTTAAMTNDTDLVAMPKSGQVDLGDGDRIASYVAAALGVSLTALLSTAGASGGSYGAEASLEPATMNNVLARQNVWIDFYRRILDVMGVKDSETRFKQVVEDPAYRTLQGLQMAFTTGAIFQDEYRKKALEQFDLENLHGVDEMPKPNAFTGAKTTDPDLAAKAQIDMAKKQLDFQKQQADRTFAFQQAASDNPNPVGGPKISAGAKKPVNDPNPRQGNKGSATLGGDNTNRDAAKTKPEVK